MRYYGEPSRWGTCCKTVTNRLQTCSACFYNTGSPLYDLRQDYKFASVGKHLPQSVELRVLDEDGNDQIQQVPGAIQLRGDAVFKRYHSNDAATKACMSLDNWFNTGDVGFLDSNGNLRIVGRSKEIVIINGKNYSSFELEYAIESSGVAGITSTYLATFSSWDDSSDSESVVVLFNFDEDDNDVKNISKTIDGIKKAVIKFCAKQPLAIIPLQKEQMPKSTIGKLSRRKLKEQFEAGSFAQCKTHLDVSSINDAPVPPKPSQSDGDFNLSLMERKIAEIFSNYTNTTLDVIILPDALQNLGVDSIGYMQIKKSLEDAFSFDKEIPFAKLLTCSSIHEVEQTLLSLGTLFWEYDPIVPLSVRGSKHPLFLIHTGAGEILTFIPLTSYLADRPVYALRAKGLREGEEASESLEAMIECNSLNPYLSRFDANSYSSYLEAIKRTQNHGPYAILGYCFGGMVAFEIAKRLEAGGEEVVFVGGIDNPPDMANLVRKGHNRLLMLELLPIFTSLTKEEAQAFSAKTKDVSLVLSIFPQ